MAGEVSTDGVAPGGNNESIDFGVGVRSLVVASGEEAAASFIAGLSSDVETSSCVDGGTWDVEGAGVTDLGVD